MKVFLISLSILLSVQILAVFSIHHVVTAKSPKNGSGKPVTINFEEVREEIKISVSGLKYHDAWLIQTAKPLKGALPSFREVLWSKKKELGSDIKVNDVKKIFTNKNKSILPKLPSFTVKKNKIDRTYLYLDHPTPVDDGGFYYTVDLPGFYKAFKNKN